MIDADDIKSILIELQEMYEKLMIMAFHFENSIKNHSL